MGNVIDKYVLLDNQKILLEHNGSVDREILLEILPKIEATVDNQGAKKAIKRKIVNIAIEALQNLQLHAYPISNNSNRPEPYFGLTTDGSHLCIIIGNLIGASEQSVLQDKLEKINSLSEDELKYLYGVIMKQTVVKFSTKGGAGLGLIDMKKKSGNNLVYSFQEADTETRYFCLKVTVPIN